MTKAGDDIAFLHALGQRMRLLRARRGMTRRILAAQSGVSERYISAVESGTGNGSILLLRALAQALNVGLRALLEDEAEAIAPVLARTVSRNSGWSVPKSVAFLTFVLDFRLPRSA